MVLFVLAGLLGLAGFLAGGMAGSLWGKFGQVPQLSAPTFWVVTATGAVKGGLTLGGIGFLPGVCLGAFIFWDLSRSYVRAVEAPDMALLALVVLTVPPFIIGVVGGGLLAVLRYLKGA